MGVANNLVDKSGSWYSYNGDRIGQGKENAKQFLLDNPEIANDIDRKLRDMLLPKPRGTESEAEGVEQDAAVGES
jgi:recombination protein RecA